MNTSEADLSAHHGRARALLAKAYAPYSQFPVAAVVVTGDGAVHEGVNVENAAYGSTICAERMAIGAMVTAGDRSGIVAVVIAGRADDPLSPCGACRQVIAEFSTPDTLVASRGASGRTATWPVGDLLRAAFGPLALAAGTAGAPAGGEPSDRAAPGDDPTDGPEQP